MDPAQLYDKLKKLHEPQGYLFNPDKEMAMELVGNLINNMDRYGYMSCPCRLASGERDYDKDIICPCVYREPDVKEFGSCYCGLYVSQGWIDGKIPHEYVPERRPAEKTKFI